MAHSQLLQTAESMTKTSAWSRAWATSKMPCMIVPAVPHFLNLWTCVNLKDLVTISNATRFLSTSRNMWAVIFDAKLLHISQWTAKVSARQGLDTTLRRRSLHVNPKHQASTCLAYVSFLHACGACILSYIYIYVCVCLSIFIFSFICIYMCKYIYVCVYSIWIHTHTHTRVYIHAYITSHYITYHYIPLHTITYHYIQLRKLHTITYHYIQLRKLHTIIYIHYHTFKYHCIHLHTITYTYISYHTIPRHSTPYHATPCHTTPHQTIPDIQLSKRIESVVHHYYFSTILLFYTSVFLGAGGVLGTHLHICICKQMRMILPCTFRSPRAFSSSRTF